MGNVTVEIDEPPVFVVKGHGKLQLDECKQQCGHYEVLFDKEQPFISLVDYRDAKLAPSLSVHRFLGKWSKDHYDITARLSPASAIVIKSALVKTIVNPILKMMSLPNDVRMFNDYGEACRWLERTAQAHGIEGPFRWR